MSRGTAEACGFVGFERPKRVRTRWSTASYSKRPAGRDSLGCPSDAEMSS